MHLHETLDVPVGAHRTAQLLADPAVGRAIGAHLGALDQDVAVTGDAAGAFTVVARRRLATDAVPAHLRGFVGASIEVRQTDAWQAPAADGARAATVVVEVAGTPVRLAGTARLTPSGPDASALVYDGEVRATIPLFGSAIERGVADAIRAALAATVDELGRAGA